MIDAKIAKRTPRDENNDTDSKKRRNPLDLTRVFPPLLGVVSLFRTRLAVFQVGLPFTFPLLPWVGFNVGFSFNVGRELIVYVWKG